MLKTPIFLLLTLPLLASCGSTLTFLKGSGPFSVNIQGTRAYIEGELKAGDGKAFLDAVDGKTISSLSVNSDGGEVEDGMDIGTYVFDQQLPVEVNGICNSSCANYIIASSPAVTVKPGSVILFHGGVEEHHDASIIFVEESIPPEKRDSVRAYIQRIEARETEFLIKIRMNTNFLALSRRFVDQNKIEGWPPTQAEMNCYGYHIGSYTPPQQCSLAYLISSIASFPPVLKCNSGL